MEVNVNELFGSALDWAVAKAIGAYAAANGSSEIWGCKIWSVPGFENMRWDDWTPSTDWAQGGPLIDRYTVDRDVLALNRGVRSKCWSDGNGEEVMCYPAVVGPTALIAACRAIVVAMIGPVVNVPDELL